MNTDRWMATQEAVADSCLLAVCFLFSKPSHGTGPLGHVLVYLQLCKTQCSLIWLIVLAAGLNLCSSFGQWNTRISSRRLGFLVDIPGYSCLGETSNMFTPRSYVNNWYSSLSLVSTSVTCLEVEKSSPEVLPTSCCQQLVPTVTWSHGRSFTFYVLYLPRHYKLLPPWT